MKINYICYMPYLRNSIYSIWSWFLVHLCEMISPGAVFHCFDIFVLGCKRAKNGSRWQKKSVAVYISGTIYHMIVIYGTLCKLMISLGVSFIFSKFWFCGLLRGSKYKKWPKMTKNFVLCTLYLRNYTSFLDLWCTYLHVFFTIFPNFNFQGQ